LYPVFFASVAIGKLVAGAMIGSRR
jgi:hypothetical protein